MKIQLTAYGNTIGDLIDALRQADRKLKVEVVMRTGSNRGKEEKMKPFQASGSTHCDSYFFKVTNHKSRS